MNHHARFSRQFAVATMLSLAVSIFFLRYLWSLSLGNGDELFFSTGAGRFEIGEGSREQWRDFFSWLWWEHTGRTADWISGAIYYFGPDAGRWMASILAALSAGVITWCLHRLSRYMNVIHSQEVVMAPISMLTLLFSYSATGLKPLANLTMYSAAVANYLIPSALIFVVITITLTAKKLPALYSASVIGLFVASMHEQAAAVLLILAVIFVVRGPSKWPLTHRILSSLIVGSGIIEMFSAPGLHAKLARVATVEPETALSMPRKVITTFYTFGAYYSIPGLLISVVVAFYLISYTRVSKHKRWSWALLGGLFLSTTIWATSIFFPNLNSQSPPQVINGAACIVMVTIWLVTPLISTNQAVRFGFILLSAAAASLAIPAAAGLSAVRVLNFPIVFLLGFILWNAQSVVGAAILNTGLQRQRLTRVLSRLLIPAILIFISIWVMVHSVVAFRANYDPGIADLKKQAANCKSELCPATDPLLPYPQAKAGYGNHNYANTSNVLEWLGK